MSSDFTIWNHTGDEISDLENFSSPEQNEAATNEVAGIEAGRDDGVSDTDMETDLDDETADQTNVPIEPPHGEEYSDTDTSIPST